MLTSRTRLSSAPLVLLLAACGDEARISTSAYLAAPLAIEMLEVTVRDGGRLLQWSGSDFKSTPQNPIPSTPEVETSVGGPDLELTYRLQSAGTVISTGTVVLPRKSDWRWSVSVHSATTNPEENCFGCFGAQVFPLAEAFRTPGQDSIWVVWGGNSIDDPAIY
jgi:hypothetical protein